VDPPPPPFWARVTFLLLSVLYVKGSPSTYDPEITELTNVSPTSKLLPDVLPVEEKICDLLLNAFSYKGALEVVDP
jgi:hypothetical protein